MNPGMRERTHDGKVNIVICLIFTKRLISFAFQFYGKDLNTTGSKELVCRDRKQIISRALILTVTNQMTAKTFVQGTVWPPYQSLFQPPDCRHKQS